MGRPGGLCTASGRALVAAGACALVLTACGDQERQDADEPRGTFPVAVTETRFPERQRLADRTRFVIEVRNTGSQTIPDIAVTLDGLEGGGAQSAGGDRRTIWVLESGPEGGDTAYVDTWAKGRLPPGRSARFEWDVTAVEAGTHRLAYRVAASLDGEARAVGRGGRPAAGQVTIAVSGKPAGARVDPDTGRVLRGGDRDVRDDEPPDPDEPLGPFDRNRGGE